MLGNVSILLASITLVCGCSSEQIYTAIQENRQFECKKLPQPQYEECMKDYDQSYDSYRRDREEIVEEKR
ncbi:MAG: hypothetical protein JXA04_12010 [Gammaproteobacteria bacterium]|nr:hypothetical protein [Gammaproteobacteria bacterium]